jgi:outer membrane immunogenic protein
VAIDERWVKKGGLIMRKLLTSIAMSSTMLAISVVANAADLSVKAPAPVPVYVPPPFTWTGFYLGGNFGGGWASTTATDNLTGANLTSNLGGWLGGGQVGFNYQAGNIVWGVEGTFDWTSLNSTSGVAPTAFGNLQASANTQWVTTLAARLGIAMDRWLVYGKGGAGWVGNNTTVTNQTTGLAVSSSNTNSGWLVGGGVEYAFTPNWTAKLEYDYLGLRGWTAGSPLPGDTVNVKRQINMVMAGINYKFGGW